MPSTTKPDRLKAAHDRLTRAVEEIVSGDDWARMLKVASKFHHYSFNNQLMIFAQRPDATLVTGFRKWQELNRFVRKGEEGIQIFVPVSGPCRSCDGKGGIRENGKLLSCSRCMGTGRYQGFKVGYVFDVSQTEGEPLEDLDAIRPKLLTGDAPNQLWDALVAQADVAGFEVVRARKTTENGYCDFRNKEIGVRPDIDGLQAVKTLIHELAHALLHGDGSTNERARGEVEVESAAYVVLDALGFPSGEYSFPYVARWSHGDVETVKETADRAVSCARQILSGLETGSSDRAVRVAASE